MKRSSLLLAGSLLAPLGVTGCADACLDDGLLQSSQDGGCPVVSGGDTGGTAAESSTSGDVPGTSGAPTTGDSNDGDSTEPTTGLTEDGESTGAPESTEYCEDVDGDGFGDPATCVDVPSGEDPPSGHVPNADDCLDDNGAVFPGAAAEEPELCAADADGDGHADASPPDGADAGSDCIDDDATVYPGAASEEPELCTSDADGDGYGPEMPTDGADAGGDCVDSNAAVFPGAAAEEPELCTTDADGDGYGDDDATDQEPNAENGTDCVDSDADTFPGAAELDDKSACMADADDDGYGNSSPPAGATPGTDCDDASVTTPAVDLCLTWCIDADSDGFGDPDNCVAAVTQPKGHAGNALDCDDGNGAVYTGAAESEPALCTADVDDDGYGDSNITDTSPNAENGTDCDDADVSVFAGAAENEPALCTVDADNDGYGDANATDAHPNAENGSDCADDAVTIYPGAASGEPTLCTIDGDGDGYGDADATSTNANADNGTDCVDDAATIYPGAATEEPALCTIDGDGDGYGDDAATSVDAGAENGTDCADDNADAYPGSASSDSASGCYLDADDDGYGDADPPDGITPGTDCDDSDPGVPFVLDGIPETCEIADSLRSSLGCEFFSVSLSNNGGAAYSVLLANANAASDASVLIEQYVGGAWTTVAGPLTVSSGSQLAQSLADNASPSTEIRSGGSYRITSDIPIAAYQASVQTASSDASLLLPSTSWGSEYAVVGFDGLGGSHEEYVGIVAQEDGTDVTVTPSRATTAGAGIGAGVADTPMTFTLNEGETALVMSPGNGGGIATSLSGTLVSASSPVGLFTGTECSNVPTGTSFCDHLEEMLPPTTAASTSVVASRVPVRGTTPEPMLWQIYAVADATVTFDALDAVTGLPAGPVDIEAGDSLELSVSGTTDSPGDFVIESTSPIIASGYITGAGGVGTAIPGMPTGDPAQVVPAAASQMLQSYVVGTVEGNAIHHVTVTHQIGAEPVTLDGAEVAEETYLPINADWEVARIVVAEGSHALNSDDPFAVMVTGYNSANSYAYLGGGQARVLVCE